MRGTWRSLGELIFGCLVLLATTQWATAQFSATDPWIEIQQQPPQPPGSLIAGEVIPPGDQPRVALWNHRVAFDVFGRPIPSQIVYDTELLGVLVNATLLADGTDEPRDMLGQNLLITSCGRAQFTNLQIQKVGMYKLLFSATYFSTNETTNITAAFKVPFSLSMSAFPLELFFDWLSAGCPWPATSTCTDSRTRGVLGEAALSGAAHNRDPGHGR